jgi:hypothetical protein
MRKVIVQSRFLKIVGGVSLLQDDRTGTSRATCAIAGRAHRSEHIVHQQLAFRCGNDGLRGPDWVQGWWPRAYDENITWNLLLA